MSRQRTRNLGERDRVDRILSSAGLLAESAGFNGQLVQIVDLWPTFAQVRTPASRRSVCETVEMSANSDSRVEGGRGVRHPEATVSM